MSIVINGSGSITGLTSGSGISASALSGQVPDANAPSGSVLQVVEASTTTQTSSTSATWADTGLSGSITPTSASNKIAVMWNSPCLAESNNEMHIRIVRNGTAITTSYKMTNSAGTLWTSMAGVILDNPSTTSSITYKIQIQRNTGSGTVYFGTSNDPSTSRMIMMEIAA
jgi:hypothetical protein